MRIQNEALRAAIDIGSNTFRMLIAQPVADKPWKTVYYTHRIVRLGEGLHHTGRLSDAGMERAVSAMNEFADIIREHGLSISDNTTAVATAAMREAGNGAELHQRILDQTGIDIQVVDGDTEARLSLAGASAVLHTETRQDMLLFDIGGGSTEFVRAGGGNLLDAISRKMGVVRLVEAHLDSDPPSTPDYQAMLQTADTHLIEVETHWGDGRIPKHLVGTAGTVTTLAAVHLNLHPYDAERINNHIITADDFFALRNRLLGLTHNQRQALAAIEQGRADLLVAGLAIIEAIIRRWDYQEISVVDAGLLEGAWLNRNE
jgi:exopolyphosphatase/guanosine-5'-triphosphate,3'-diphosphate pyrophosphatase